MRKLLLGDLASVFETLADNAVHIRREAQHSLHGTPYLEVAQKNIRGALDNISELGTMPNSLVYAARVLEIAENVPADWPDDPQERGQRVNKNIELASKIDTLLERMRDELNNTICFVVPADRARYFGSKEPFGEMVALVFPRSIVDVEEAAK